MRKLPLWIEERGGLDFSCTKCGDCCTGAPGYVWVELDEVERLAALLGLARDDFGRRFLRSVDGDLSLVEKPGGDCVFFERGGRGCTVYDARPMQCRTYPFWPETIRTEAAWLRETARCPGIRAAGERYEPLRVQRLMNGVGET